MAIIAMAVFDTVENKRSWMTDECLGSLSRTVDFRKHRLVVVDNGSCEETQGIIQKWEKQISWYGPLVMHTIRNETNRGQATALNQAWSATIKGESDYFRCRIDNDVQFLTPGWLDLLEECIKRDPMIGIAALKHPDLHDCPEADGWAKTTYHTIPHQKGEPHLIAEKINHCLGAVQLINPKLFAKIGYLKQFGMWGYEDSNMALRCRLAGFCSAYIHGAGHFRDLDIDKVVQYQDWKNAEAKANEAEMNRINAEYESGTRPLYVEFSG